MRIRVTLLPKYRASVANAMAMLADRIARVCARQKIGGTMARKLRGGVSGLTRGPSAMICGAFIAAIGAATPSVADSSRQPAAADATWASCKQVPTRRCVLHHAVDVTLGLRADADTPDFKITLAKTSALWGIAIAQLELGLAQDASETIDLLGTTPTSLGIIVRIKAAAGKLDDAERIARMTTPPFYPGLAAGTIAVTEGKAGSIDAALRRVQSVEDAKERAMAIRRAAWGLRFVAAHRGQDGKIAEALRQSQSISVPCDTTKPWTCVPALQIIVDAQIRTGRVAEAMQAARSVDDVKEREAVLASSLLSLAGSGRVSEALRIALAFDDPAQRHGVLFSATEKPLRLGSLPTEPNKPTVQPLWDRVLFVDSYEDTEISADVQGKVDSEALAVAKSFPGESGERDMALRIVAEAQARAGEPNEAAAAARLIDSPDIRFDVLLAVGLAQANAGQRAQAAASFHEAAQIAYPKPANTLFERFTDYLRPKLPPVTSDLPQLGVAEAKADLIAEALAVAKSIENQRDRARVLSEVARAQARAGRTADALQTAELTKKLLGYRSEVSEELVVAGLAEGGQVSELIQTLDARSSKWTDPLARISAIRDAAISLARAGNASGALQVAQMLEKAGSSDVLIETLAQIALALRRAGADASAAVAIRMATDSIASAPETEQHLPERLTYLSYALPH
jgi:hypothetical protein